MINFELNEEQELLRQEVHRFAEERIGPGTAERDKGHIFPAEILAEMGEMGLLGMMVEEQYDGPGFDVLSYLIAVEEIARRCASTAVTMSVTNSVCCWPIQRFGSEELKKRVLGELVRGTLGGFGLTEPNAGSDPGALRTTAVRDGDTYILNGEKAWITNAGPGRYFVVIARTNPEAGKRGISAFVVPAETPGFTVGTPEEKLGIKASRTAPLYFTDCRISADNLLGQEGMGFKIALATLDHSRLGIAAQAIGIHRRALELAVSYAKDRQQFGVPIAEHQAIQWKIAEMSTQLAAAKTLTHYAGVMAHHSSGGRLASEAKVYASEAANHAVREAVQIHGGNGFCEDYEVARLYRDVRVTTIYEGTSEVQRMVIARHLLRG
jgi:butyryl-CoA dehydrogenase